MGRGIYLGVEGAGTNMSDTGGLIVYKIIGWKITTMKIKGVLEHPEHPPGYAAVLHLMLSKPARVDCYTSSTR